MKVSVSSRKLTESWDHSILGNFGLKRKRPLGRLKQGCRERDPAGKAPLEGRLPLRGCGGGNPSLSLLGSFEPVIPHHLGARAGRPALPHVPSYRLWAPRLHATPVRLSEIKLDTNSKSCEKKGSNRGTITPQASFGTSEFGKR